MNKPTLIIIDPQFDFCDPKGALSVPGADKGYGTSRCDDQ